MKKYFMIFTVFTVFSSPALAADAKVGETPSTQCRLKSTRTAAPVRETAATSTESTTTPASAGSADAVPANTK